MEINALNPPAPCLKEHRNEPKDVWRINFRSNRNVHHHRIGRICGRNVHPLRPQSLSKRLLGPMYLLGIGGDNRHLRHRFGFRNPCQSGRYLGTGALPRLPLEKVLPYWAAQVIGAFIGAMIVYQLYSPVIDYYNHIHQLTRDAGGAAGVFFTSTGMAITPIHALGDEIILTAFLIFGIFAITERFNEAAPTANSGALVIGLLVATIGACMGYLEGWAINPARDLGPRLFAFLAGWGESAFPEKITTGGFRLSAP